MIYKININIARLKRKHVGVIKYTFSLFHCLNSVIALMLVCSCVHSSLDVSSYENW